MGNRDMKFNDLGFFGKLFIRITMTPLALFALVIVNVILFIRYFIELPKAVKTGRLATQNEIYSSILNELWAVLGTIILTGNPDVLDKVV